MLLGTPRSSHLEFSLFLTLNFPAPLSTLCALRTFGFSRVGNVDFCSSLLRSHFGIICRLFGSCSQSFLLKVFLPDSKYSLIIDCLLPCFLGLFGGAIYANTFYLASEEIEESLREFCMSSISFWYSFGILFAGLLGTSFFLFPFNPSLPSFFSQTF